MTLKDDFSSAALKFLLSVISLVIIFPVISHTSDIALYVTVSVFVLGKFVDLLGKISQRQLALFYVIYILGIFVGIAAVAMCFYGFASMPEAKAFPIGFNITLVVLAAVYSFIDLADFVYCIVRTIYTKKQLHHFTKNT